MKPHCLCSLLIVTTLSARLHRYSGVVQKSKGVEGQCCISHCTSIFPGEQANGWMGSYLKEHATNRNDMEKVGPVCK